MRKTATPEQIAKAKEKRARLCAIAKQIAKMTDEQRRELVKDWPTTIEGHSISVHNACLLAYQGGATVIGGFRQWKRAGRHVRKGEHGKSIWIPLGARKQGAEPTGEAEDIRFGLGTVFDIAQTDACGLEVAA